MKESNWSECLNFNLARKVTPDIKRANSLTETAKERISLIKDINQKNCNFIFEDYYTSLIELLQALVLNEGYQILNHLCLGYYLKDKLKRKDLFLIFDDLRYKRNSLIYYGSKMDFETAKDAIEKCRTLIKEIKGLSKK